jgi:3-phenylpropionate/trans-cinnamate dioxygenase ferredoxin subunit
MSTTARWITVASAADIPLGSRRVLRLEDQPIAVFHLEEGWYAIDDVCTHDGGPVAEGRLEVASSSARAMARHST